MKKYIADTNFILRYLLADDDLLYKKSQEIFEQARIGKCQIEIEQTIFTEVIFVLSSFYEVPKEEIVSILKSLLLYKGIKANKELYIEALSIYLEHNIHIVDSILAARTIFGSEEILTFDKKLIKIIKDKF